MNAAAITALFTGIAGVLGAAAALIGLFLHAKNHQDGPPPPKA